MTPRVFGEGVFLGRRFVVAPLSAQGGFRSFFAIKTSRFVDPSSQGKIIRFLPPVSSFLSLSRLGTLNGTRTSG
jgi:hypothetical protein